MTDLPRRDIEHIFEQLRKGLVPERGLDAFAVGIDRQRGEIHRQLDLVAGGEGSIKFLRGGYGCGKTFFSRWLQQEARAMNFATAEVQISETETPLHKLETVYRRMLERLATSSARM